MRNSEICDLFTFYGKHFIQQYLIVDLTSKVKPTLSMMTCSPPIETLVTTPSYNNNCCIEVPIEEDNVLSLEIYSQSFHKDKFKLRKDY